MPDDMREAFEAWVISTIHLPYGERCVDVDWAPSGYPVACSNTKRVVALDYEWRDWQAACACQRERDAAVAEGHIHETTRDELGFPHEGVGEKAYRFAAMIIAAAIRGENVTTGGVADDSIIDVDDSNEEEKIDEETTKADLIHDAMRDLYLGC